MGSAKAFWTTMKVKNMRRMVSVLFLGAIAQVHSSFAADVSEKATFAAGCFWCVESAFEGQAGVISVISGFTGGDFPSPTYQEVSSGNTDHAESVQITYDPSTISFDKLLSIYWRNTDPFDFGGQFCDRGLQYRPFIFYHSESQKLAAEKSKERIEKERGRTVLVPITQAKQFYPVEEYHQDYYKKDPRTYTQYRQGCGRDRRLEELWGKGSSH
jgi:peptide-methionine (S)-S-oxide reductase